MASIHPVPPREPNHSELVDSHWSSLKADRATPISGRLGQLALVLLGVDLAIGVWIRFSTTSLMWLDEALSVSIAKLPVASIPAALKHDGAPPLYYVLLHFWMQIFGSTDFSSRAFSGICAVAAVGVTFVAVRRLWGLEVAAITAALFAASSYAAYYATEARMYALVTLLVAFGILAITRLFERPTPLRAGLVALIAASLLYTHYWSLYLLAAVGAWFVAAGIFGTKPDTRRSGRFGAGSLVVAGLAFLPWLPTFLFQSAHTGTPWAVTPRLQASVTGVLHFYDNQGAQPSGGTTITTLLGLVSAALIIGAVFGVAKSGTLIELDLRSRVPARLMTWIVFATMTIGIVGAHMSKSAFVPRYASVVFIPFLILIAIGTGVVAVPWVRLTVVGFLVVGMLSCSLAGTTTQRTQSRAVASVIAQHAQPGDLVAFCPDQLGPSTMRVLPNGNLRTVAYPRFNDPRRINWVNYAMALKSTTPKAFAERLDGAADGHSVWLVWSTGYGTYKDTCGHLASALINLPGWGGHQWVNAHPKIYYQSMNLTQFAPPEIANASTSAP